MRGSEALRFLALTALFLALLVAGVAGRVVWFDAYWIFREDPPWRAATDGNSRLLDRQTRRAKVLQALTRPYDLALIGSSTVYHGLDPADVTAVAPSRVFNAGISAIIATELPVIAAVVAARAPARATLGLDYYMFSRPSVPVHLDEALANPSGRLAALMGSVLGRYALADSRLAAVTGVSLRAVSPTAMPPRRSAPAQKPRPAPVSTTTRTSPSSRASSSACAHSRSMTSVKAFMRSGRLSVIVAMPSRFS